MKMKIYKIRELDEETLRPMTRTAGKESTTTTSSKAQLLVDWGHQQ